MVTSQEGDFDDDDSSEVTLNLKENAQEKLPSARET
jgi:hypothetical protein